MAYYDISLLAADYDFTSRVRACAASEGATDPVQWAMDHIWQVAGAPTFGDRYAYAIATGVPNPGRDPSVIPDADILSAVQAIGVTA